MRAIKTLEREAQPQNLNAVAKIPSLIITFNLCVSLSLLMLIKYRTIRDWHFWMIVEEARGNFINCDEENFLLFYLCMSLSPKAPCNYPLKKKYRKCRNYSLDKAELFITLSLSLIRMATSWSIDEDNNFYQWNPWSFIIRLTLLCFFFDFSYCFTSLPITIIAWLRNMKKQIKLAWF